MDLKRVSTKDLVKELDKRVGVEMHSIPMGLLWNAWIDSEEEDGSDTFIDGMGPTILMIITD